MRGEYIYRTEGYTGPPELPPRARRILTHFLIHCQAHGTTSACAENTARIPSRHASTGNYLRVRGEYCARRTDCDLAHGTTSACAENTRHSYSPRPRCWNYLRVRGEYSVPDASWPLLRELPPRARRILVVVAHDEKFKGTTSACAENTFLNAAPCPSMRNYLRVRGEYHFRSRVRCFRWELPPRARRILDPTPLGFCTSGTTSACAENTTP